MRAVTSALVFTALAASVIVACTNDFDVFERDPASADLAQSDAASDGAPATGDASPPPDGAAGADGGTGACAVCAAALATCRDKCETEKDQCDNACGGSNSCRSRCRRERDDCRSTCSQTCRSCAGSACTDACN